MPPDRIAACADLLAEIRLGDRQLPALPDALRPRDEPEAYAVQFALHDRLRQAGLGRRAGWKIGCTTEVMQQFLGIGSPCAGGMFETGIRSGPAAFPHAGLRKPGVECEIAVRLAMDVPTAGAPYHKDGIARYVGAVMAAMEVVEERFIDFRDRAVDAPSLIAEDFFHVAAVLAPERPEWQTLDLAALTGQTWIAGEERGSGAGADVMGHPFAALAWLANHLAEFGLALAAGDVVLTGSVVASQYPEGPAEAVTEIARLGRVTTRFT
ncbi:MAG: fumarylacetoacetate hydrolase family protein [Alphaproteobacteria bacterium]|jgi:2-oxo-3-hexenedioate decarboxylase/2-keto-4-pentenoate hydratase|nr:fumarylacetoacetate hydrolase family protein [Alphaproteobacteria bacterium]MDP6564229.1 fumarylacetoacetate hydrolase family protein [Alphaproteobacteria bacterium]MDP6814001.1 fumarylacetoacetate hydrolase family protein [Alphaproteobacteria bacterium]